MLSTVFDDDRYVESIAQSREWLAEDEAEMVPFRLEQIASLQKEYARDTIRLIWLNAERAVYHTYRRMDDDQKARAIWQTIVAAREVWSEQFVITM